MFAGLIIGFLNIIKTLGDSLLVAPIDLVTALFPDITNALNYVISYLSTILQFVPLCLDFLMIPRQAIVFLFDYYIIKYSIYLITRVIKLVLAVYNKLKI